MLTCQDALFSLPETLHYLNCAYMSPLLRSAEAAGIEGLQRKRNPASFIPSDFFDEARRARRAFARLLEAPNPDTFADRVAVVPAVSYAMATIAANTPLERGQNVVVAAEQFPSNVYPWRRLAREAGAEIRTVEPPTSLPLGEPGRGATWNDRLLEAIDGATALVALPHVHWADGTRFDLEALSARARAVGAAFVIDGTQSVGALPFGVETIRPDALVCAGYKWLMGPYGIGLAYYGDRYAGGVPLEETWIGRAGSEHFGGLVRYRDDYQPGAVRYDVGERSNFILLPMLIAGLEQLLAWGVGAVQDYCQALASEIQESAQALGFAAGAEGEHAGHLFGLAPPSSTPTEALQAALQDYKVSLSVRGSVLRISPHVYNDASDVGALLQALEAAQSMEPLKR